MKKSGEDVLKYIKAYAIINFPENHVCCGHCQLLKPEALLKRQYCSVTGEYITGEDYTIGNFCPLIFEDKVNEKQE